MSMLRFSVLLVLSVCLAAPTMAAVEFQLLTSDDNIGLLPQPKGQAGVSGDHLLRTADDITGGSFNPSGCFSFNLMNPVGILEPDYPPGYAEGLHSLTGSLRLDVDLLVGGAAAVESLAFDGYVAPSKPIAAQRLVNPGDPAADGAHGPVNGAPNSGSYAASATSDWAFQASFDWYYDTPAAGAGTIDLTFDNYAWDGFIIPVSELTCAGLSAAMLDDPLGYFGGGSADFESWLLGQVAPRLPSGASYLLFAQGEAHPDWTNPSMGMTTDGVVGETVIAYAVPEPAGAILLLAGSCLRLGNWRTRKPSRSVGAAA